MGIKLMLIATAVMAILAGCTQAAKEDYSQAGQDATRAARKTGDGLATDAKATGQKIEQSADKAGKATAEATRNTGAAIRKAATNAQAGGTLGNAGTTGKVKTALLRAPGIDASKIDVDTSGNKVILKGGVRTAAEKHLAAQIAQKQAGAGYKIANQLTVSK